MRIKMFLSVLTLCFSMVSSVFAGDEHEVSGTVNSVDKSARTINISHGPIKTMGMSAMTMNFAVADPAMLDEIKAGQKIDFVLTTDRKGRFVIVDLQ
ncbi:MAG: copper-binding protein [Gammaproteobacteria bacterium]|nr:copper-binding protein [Gammaproteobacteria bacterium]MDH5727666.1 copper-binding protein [Gammaproteobacteria bacterium]